MWRMEEGWVLVKELSARSVPTEEPRQRESALLVELRQELAWKDGQIEAGGERCFHKRAVTQRTGLPAGTANVPWESPSRLETSFKLGVIVQRLPAVEADGQRFRGQIDIEPQNLDAERQQLVSRNSELVAQEDKIMAQGRELQTSYGQLQLQLHDSVTVQQERDAAYGRVLFLQHELATAQAATENVIKEAQEESQMLLARSDAVEAGSPNIHGRPQERL
ncbi:hypothetical protein BBP40_006657 [Aspergillus hancockii]|nr:hypothetical protein BBP40_006657 [Aspergillus hancockii]